MSGPNLSPELQRLRRRFIGLMLLQGLLGAAAAGFAVVYFAFHQAWGLPAFAAALAVALAAQIRFILVFRNGRG